VKARNIQFARGALCRLAGINCRLTSRHYGHSQFSLLLLCILPLQRSQRLTKLAESAETSEETVMSIAAEGFVSTRI
jgi:hypothetical protein